MPRKTARPAAHADRPSTYQFTITLRDTQPPIWRRIRLGDGSLDDLHAAIQAAMGWADKHRHYFHIDDRHYGRPDRLADQPFAADVVDSAATSLADVLRADRTPLRFAYEDDTPLWDKMAAIATKVYGAAGIEADAKVRAQVERLQADGYGRWPVCVAKTQYSFSTDPTLRGAPSGHTVRVREVRLAAGARFVVMICGDVMTMPGLPKVPAAHAIDVDDDGRITGLF